MKETIRKGEFLLDLLSLLLIAVGLSMDAFAAALCKGLSLRELKVRQALAVGGYFGAFQAVMPLAGYLLARFFRQWVEQVDHWLAFGLLCLIGCSMIAESSGKKGTQEAADPRANDVSPGVMLPLAFATSVDALAVGVAFALSGTYRNIFLTVAVIGLITFALSVLGVSAGRFLGERFRARAELLGGVLLILMGARILLSDLGLFFA